MDFSLQFTIKPGPSRLPGFLDKFSWLQGSFFFFFFFGIGDCIERKFTSLSQVRGGYLIWRSMFQILWTILGFIWVKNGLLSSSFWCWSTDWANSSTMGELPIVGNGKIEDEISSVGRQITIIQWFKRRELEMKVRSWKLSNSQIPIFSNLFVKIPIRRNWNYPSHDRREMLWSWGSPPAPDSSRPCGFPGYLWYDITSTPSVLQELGAHVYRRTYEEVTNKVD